MSLADLTAVYEAQLAGLNSMSDFRHARVTFDADAFVPRAVRDRYALLPSSVPVRDREVEIHYDVEESPEGNLGVARLRLPEKLARTLSEDELPALDRPLRFIVMRGVRGAARGKTLDELQDELERPFTDKEIAELERDDEATRRHDRGTSARAEARGVTRTRRDAGQIEPRASSRKRGRDDRPPRKSDGRRREAGGERERSSPPGRGGRREAAGG